MKKAEFFSHYLGIEMEIIMKLKYYLRGLGIGIVVTVIIMSVIKKPETLTDAQIKMRALELGMVEESVLADLKEDNDGLTENSVEEIVNIQEEIADETKIESEEESDMHDTEEALQEESESDAKLTQEEIKDDESSKEVEVSINEDFAAELEEMSEIVTNEVTEMVTNDMEEAVENYIIINVERGNGSEIVSQRLFEAGLVNSKAHFNLFNLQYFSL